jgi:1-acyl-sn-glycerol-3-phosphate acyltransferase
LKSIYWFFRATFQAFFKIFNRLEVVGSDCVPKTGGVIVAVNHVSYLDPLVIGAALRRRATYMAREGLFNIPLIGTFVGSFSFPVRRGKPRPSTIKEAVKRLNRGELIVMFPEGGRSAGGDILDAKRGVGMIAVMSKAPIVPALISGTERSLPVGAKVVKPAKIKVKFGKSIEINREEPDKDFQERICRNIMDEIRRLKG